MTTAERELLITTRRDLHRHPELGYEEHRTAGIAADRLRKAGYEVETGIAVTGVVGRLRGQAGNGRTLMLRADMDALPIHEQCTHEYVSTAPGKMHACGHDAHVSIGLAVAERLARRRSEWRGEVRYVFQPAEEGGGGALRMIEAGLLEGIDAALGLHVWLGLPSGVVGVVDGPFMAGSQEFRISIRGRGGHGAIPHETVDAVVVGSQLVVALQTVVSRSIAPMEAGVLSVGTFRAGDASNVIADSAVLEGTVRAFSQEVLDGIRQRIGDVAEGVCATFGATCEAIFGGRPYPPTINDPEMSGIVRAAAERVVGAERVLGGDDVRTMAAEDFSEYALRVPGCYFFVGARNPEVGARHPHHSPRFQICEEALPVAVEVLEAAALDYLDAGAAE